MIIKRKMKKLWKQPFKILIKFSKKNKDLNN